MIQRTFADETRYIYCPGCQNSRHAVSHLPVGTKTMWYCDECGIAFHLHVLGPDEVDCEIDATRRKEKTLVTLRSDGPVTLIVEGMRLIGGPDYGQGGDHGDQYFYDDHTCPINFMSDVVRVIDFDGDEDPHGVFAWVKTEDWRELDGTDGHAGGA